MLVEKIVKFKSGLLSGEVKRRKSGEQKEKYRTRRCWVFHLFHSTLFLPDSAGVLSLSTWRVYLFKETIILIGSGMGDP